MTDDGIGRLLVASLHQSIGEELPTRLDYYEHWLSPMGLREGRSGLAPLGAVLSFLRQEGEGAYGAVMTTAGRLSAEWHFAEGGMGRRVVAWQPRWLRRRSALKGAARLLRAGYQPLVVATAVRRGRGTLSMTGSVFCSLRDTWPWPTCAYAAAAVTRHLELLGFTPDVRIDTCRAQGGQTCTLTVHFDGRPEGESA
ncbi:MAG: hypothetical protein JNL48_04785 [Acidobacteria bacterium]|nr:hypothetical protein [Acidobacteriota bacterium]